MQAEKKVMGLAEPVASRGSNLRAYFTMQDMKRRGSFGHIINISSLSGYRISLGGRGGGFYSATKHAVRALTEGLRQEVIPALRLSDS
jgi:NAD(P)-dependent dehydrogenase (short-subunit alcohol dehydrogenase family)